MFEWEKTIEEIIIEEVNDFFKSLEDDGLEYRASQHKMAVDVAKSLLNNKHRVVEAGVGIGKTIAYLVPALIICKHMKKKILLSTSTISLEEQLEKDLKKIIERLELYEMKPIIIKGQRNYLCELKICNDKKLTPNNKKFIRENFKINKIVNNYYDATACTSKIRLNCKQKDNCEYYKMYQERNIDSPGVLICNHNFLISYLSKDTNLKHIDYIICDEAHKLPNAIIEYYTKKFEIPNTLEEVAKYLNNLDIKNANYIINNINTVFKNLIMAMNEEIADSVKKSKIKFINYEKLPFNYFTKKIIFLAKTIYNCMTDLKIKANMHYSEELERLLEKLNMEMLVYKSLSLGQDGDYLFYANIENNKSEIYYIPKATYQLSNQLLSANKDKTFVFTSATLTTVENDYSFFLKELGLNSNYDLSNSYISPYDYKNNTIVYVDETIIKPTVRKRELYVKGVISKIEELIKITNGKTLILFTSKSDLNYVFKIIKKKIKDVNILKQQGGSSQEKVISEFKKNINSVLLATNYWEGIDIPGESLSQVIIARLPFPTVNAISENKAKVTGRSYYLNEMILKIKQGMGRLIRSSEDYGVISILDSRAANFYKSNIKQCIKESKITNNLEEVKAFIKSKVNI